MSAVVSTSSRTGVSSTVETCFALSVRGLALAMPIIVAVGATIGGVAAWSGLFVVFVALPAVELALHLTGIGLLERAGQRDIDVVDRGAHTQLVAYAVLHLAAVPYVLYLVGTGRLHGLALVGAGASLACLGGTTGGLGGHELFHKRSVLARALGLAVYGTAYYAHFAAGHIGGHHVNVGLRHDWGTARRGESIYAFLRRAFVDGFTGGLRIEAARLRRTGHRPYGVRNFVVACSLAYSGAALAIAALGGTKTLLFHLVVSLVTASFMELFNYISHYALTRPDEHGRDFSAVTWESNNKVVNWFIWNAGRHCHHHQKPSHAFDSLELFHEKTEYIPYGIAGMAIVSFIPPLFLTTMEEKLARMSAST